MKRKNYYGYAVSIALTTAGIASSIHHLTERHTYIKQETLSTQSDRTYHTLMSILSLSVTGLGMTSYTLTLHREEQKHNE